MPDRTDITGPHPDTSRATGDLRPLPMSTRVTTFEIAARVVAATALAALAAVVLFVLKVGPLVATLTATHGIHGGDALAAVPAGAALWTIRPLLRFGRGRSGGTGRRAAVMQ